MHILGIETSCDETAAAVVRRDGDGTGAILSNVVLSQTKDHAPYGGVVPEIAARAHINHLDRLVAEAMAEAGLRFDELDGVAATAGPGLLGGVIVGLTTAKAIALAHGKPLMAVNHLEGHALTPRLAAALRFSLSAAADLRRPHAVPDRRRCRAAIAGSAPPSTMRWAKHFDKTAKLLGLGYPGGPHVEAYARKGNARRFDFPRPLKGRKDCNFSFSGLKTAVREAVQALARCQRSGRGRYLRQFRSGGCRDHARPAGAGLRGIPREASGAVAEPLLIVAGGVAANATLKAVFEASAAANGFRLVVPPPRLCTDNAAMIAWAGAERLALGLIDDLGFAARARWPLDQSQAPLVGSGKLGAKV